MSTPEFYFIPEVATKLRRSEAAIRWQLHTGALRSTKFGGRRVVTQAQLEEFMAGAA